MVSAVSAGDNTTDDVPIEYKELTPQAEQPYFVIGAYVKYPMRNFDNVNLSEEEWVGSIFVDDSSNKLNTSYKTSVFDRSFDGNVSIKVDLNQNATGSIYFSFLNGTPLKVVNGSVQHKISGLSGGLYRFSYYYTGDDRYAGGVGGMSFVIPSASTKITVENNNITMYYKDGTRFRVNLENDKGPISNRNVTIVVNGVRYNRLTDSNGSASLALNINPGDYEIIAYYPGSSSTPGNMSYSRLAVLPTISGEDIVKIYRNNTQYNIKAIYSNGSAIVNKNIRFNINGVFYNRTTDENGIAKLNINLEPNSYIITAENLNDGCKISNNITVMPTLVSNDLIKIYKNKTQFTALGLKTDGTPLANSYLMFNINGVIYNRTTGGNGEAKLNINLEPGTYIITTENPYDNSKISNLITVTPYLFTQNLVKYYKNESRFAVKLVDGNYNPVANEKIIFTVNDVEYTRTTDNNGEASLAINLNPGTYEITTRSSGYYVKNTITVLSTLIDGHVGDATIYLDEGELYEVLVLDSNGKCYANQEVTFRYLSQESKVKTDENGVARFEGNRINQFNQLSIEYNGYVVYNNVFFKKYPYGIFDKMEDGRYSVVIDDLGAFQ